MPMAKLKYLLAADNNNTWNIMAKYINLMFKKRKELLKISLDRKPLIILFCVDH